VNCFELDALIEEVKPIRYTPAGVPALDLWLEHESVVEEAGTARVVKLRMRAVALGSLAETLSRQAVGSSWRFRGFLATSRNGKGVVLHLQEFKTDPSSGVHHGRTETFH
jgi:primosomal replication protein N